MTDTLIVTPQRRVATTKVPMGLFVEAHAVEMNAAVKAFDSMPLGVRRTVYRNLLDEFGALRPQFGLGANRTRMTVLQRPSDVKKNNVKIGKNGLDTLSLTTSSSGECKVFHDGRWLVLNTCAWAGLCGPLCVLSHGRGKFSTVRAARSWRTYCLFVDPVAFAMVLRHEILSADKGVDFLARFNVNSNLPWELVDALFDGVRMFAYDYSKDPTVLDGDGWLLPNYRVVYSWSERSDPTAVGSFLRRGGAVAMVTNRVKGADVRESVMVDGDLFPMVDGDLSDDRFTTPRGVVVDLYAKGAAVKRTTRFVQQLY